MQHASRTILITNESPPVGTAFAERLSGSEFDCAVVESSTLACDWITDRDVYAVVAPVECGSDALEQLSRVGQLQGAPLVCTGDANAANVVGAMRSGARDYFEIPLPDQAGLVQRFRSARRQMERSGNRAELQRLHAQYADLKRVYLEQLQSAEQSQETYYVDLSRMVTIISNIMDGIVFADSQANISLMNAVAEDLLGIKAFMAIGRTIDSLPGQSDLVTALRDDYVQLKDRREVNRTVEVHHSEQDLLYIKLHTSQVTDYQGNFAGTLTVMQDVTAEYKTDQLKNQYLSIVAHELRTPLTGIKTFSTMMAKGSLGKLNERQQRVVESMREQSLRLEHQIDKLINLGHLESEEYSQDLEVFDLCDLIAQAVAPFDQPAHDRAVNFVAKPMKEDVLVRGDRADVRRALQALIENAIKFTPDGGTVEVDLEVEDDGAVVVVSDTGVGIDPRYHRRIFEKFFQVEDPLTRHYGGAGLGLFFARNIIEAHESRIEVDSELGRGARFTFALPRVEPITDPAGASTAVHSGA